MVRAVVAVVGTSTLACMGLLVWRARKGAKAAMEQTEKMVADGPLVRCIGMLTLCPRDG